MVFVDKVAIIVTGRAFMFKSLHFSVKMFEISVKSTVERSGQSLYNLIIGVVMKVIKIGAVWCNSCHVMRPRWEEIQAENPWLQTEFYDYDESPEVMKKYSIDENLPVAILLDKDDKELQRFIGEVSKNELLEAVKAAKTQ